MKQHSELWIVGANTFHFTTTNNATTDWLRAYLRHYVCHSLAAWKFIKFSKKQRHTNSNPNPHHSIPRVYADKIKNLQKLCKKVTGFFSPATQQCIPNSDCQCWSFGRAVSLITDKNVKGSWNYSDGFHIKAQVDGEGYLQSTASHPLAVHSICPPPLNERPAPKGFAKKKTKNLAHFPTFIHNWSTFICINVHNRATLVTASSNFGHHSTHSLNSMDDEV